MFSGFWKKETTTQMTNYQQNNVHSAGSSLHIADVYILWSNVVLFQHEAKTNTNIHLKSVINKWS